MGIKKTAEQTLNKEQSIRRAQFCATAPFRHNSRDTSHRNDSRRLAQAAGHIAVPGLQKTALSTAGRIRPWTATDGRTLSSMPEINRGERGHKLLENDIMTFKWLHSNRLRNARGFYSCFTDVVSVAAYMQKCR